MSSVIENEAIEGELRAIEAHWASIETEFGKEYLLQDSYSRADFTRDAATVVVHNAELILKENAVTLAAGKRDAGRTGLRSRFEPLRSALKSKYPAYLPALPQKPGATAGEKVLLKAAQDAHDVWQRIEADPGIDARLKPLTLQGGYTAAQLLQEITNAQAAYVALESSKKSATTTRSARDTAVKAARKRAGQYRNLVLSELPAGHPLQRTLPG
jgi:hypothetical protein